MAQARLCYRDGVADDESGDDFATGVMEADEPLPSVLEVGYVVGGRYALTRALGHGGMARLWVARDAVTGSDVAIKVLRGGGPDKQQAHRKRRLEREAQTYERLHHAAIVRAHDYGTTPQGEPYLVMELLNGDDLVKMLDRQGRLGARDAVAMLLPIAEALASAHRGGVIHRDVKPANIVFAVDNNQQRAKLIDFGLVKLLGDTEVLTAAGVPIGSPSYMSPEQARGREVDPSSDMWSLCVVLYEALTGALPFVGEDHLEIRIAILDDEPKSLMDLDIDEPELWQIMERAFAKAPADRWPTSDDFCAALRAWLG
jgi:serine/threonine-protein kinase